MTLVASRHGGHHNRQSHDAIADYRGRLYPELKMLFMSGYSSTLIASHGVPNPGMSFLGKPFSAGVLRDKVREMLH